jgi:hypothetical protein
LAGTGDCGRTKIPHADTVEKPILVIGLERIEVPWSKIPFARAGDPTPMTANSIRTSKKHS